VDALKPLASLNVSAAVRCILLSRDGRKLYVLNASDSKLLQIALPDLTLEKELALPTGLKRMAMSSTGAVIAVAGGNSVAVVATSNLSLVKSFQVEVQMHDAYPIDEETMIASVVSGGTVVLSTSKSSIVKRLDGARGASCWWPTRDGRRLYSQGSTVFLPEKLNLDEITASDPRTGVSGEFAISYDGRFGVSTYGPVYRLGKSSNADRVQCGKIDPHLSASFDGGAGKIIACLASGFVKEYSLRTLEVQRTWKLGCRAVWSHFDETAKTLVVFVAAKYTRDWLQYPLSEDPDSGEFRRYEAPK
jgi:hypothetical protein